MKLLGKFGCSVNALVVTGSEPKSRCVGMKSDSGVERANKKWIAKFCVRMV